MANQIKLTLNTIETDENENVLRNNTDSFIESFTKKTVSAFTLEANSTFKDLSFGEVTTAIILILKSEENLVVKLNSGTETFTTKTIILRGSFTKIEVRNDTDNESEIEYEVYET